MPVFGFHLQIAACPCANRDIINFLTQHKAGHKYIKNDISISSLCLFRHRVHAWLLAGLDQHIFIEEEHPACYCAKYWPWLPSAYYRNSCFWGKHNSVRHFYNNYRSSYCVYALTTP